MVGLRFQNVSSLLEAFLKGQFLAYLRYKQRIDKNFHFGLFLQVLQKDKREGVESGIIRTVKNYDFAYNRRCFSGTLKGILSCFKSQKTDFSV
jgi:hypothetical protein